MSVEIPTNTSLYSFTWTAFEALREWRNEDPSCIKKVTLSLPFLLLTFVALVETVVRGVFAVLTLWGLLLPEGECKKFYTTYCFNPLLMGTGMSLALAISSALASCFTLSDKPLDHPGVLLKKIFPCLSPPTQAEHPA